MPIGRRGSRGEFVASIGALLILLTSYSTRAAEIPNAGRLDEAVRSYFAERTQRRPVDVLTRSEVQGLFAELKRKGLSVSDEKKILGRVLDDSDFLVRTLQTADGQRFLGKVAAEPLIYDRLDRIAREPGGQALIRDLVELPDGDRYAKRKTPRGVPDLLDLLPKDRSGKRRQIKDYDRPTGRIYTVKSLIKQVENSSAAVTSTASPH